jgi:limonene-1,2-epoxide hydrolase
MECSVPRNKPVCEGLEADMTSSEETVREFIATFMEAWPQGDAARLGLFFSPDATYHNIPLEPVVGRAAIEATFTGFMNMKGRVAVDIAHLLSNGPIVMIERIDHFVTPQRTLSLPLMGIIEFHDGLITAWRDYFDLGQIASEMPGGS